MKFCNLSFESRRLILFNRFNMTSNRSTYFLIFSLTFCFMLLYLFCIFFWKFSNRFIFDKWNFLNSFQIYSSTISFFMFFRRIFQLILIETLKKDFCINNLSLTFYWLFTHNIDIILFELTFYLIDEALSVISIVVEIFFKFVVKDFNDEILCFNCFAFLFRLTLVNF